MKRFRRITTALLGMTLSFVLTVNSVHGQDVFYAASGSNGVAGSLYTLNPATGAATLVGALTDGTNPYGITGLAFQPGSGTLFGVTSNASPTAPGNLVTINPLTGAVTVIGALNVGGTMSDITFTPNGTLYGWHASGDHSLYTINIATGASTLVGLSGVGGGFGGGSLAANASGTIFSTPDSSTNPPGSLRTIDAVTGLDTIVASLSGGVVGSNVINSSAFNSGGILYGINSDQGAPTLNHLVTIDTSTGVITDVGNTLIGDIDGLAILITAVPEPTTWAFLGLAGLVTTGSFYWRKRKNRTAVRGWDPAQ